MLKRRCHARFYTRPRSMSRDTAGSRQPGSNARRGKPNRKRSGSTVLLKTRGALVCRKISTARCAVTLSGGVGDHG